jgi:hypothetical protein
MRFRRGPFYARNMFYKNLIIYIFAYGLIGVGLDNAEFN